MSISMFTGGAEFVLLAIYIYIIHKYIDLYYIYIIIYYIYI